MRQSFCPDFIGIGAIKSGTTWLHIQLLAHPAIGLPRTKELEFFDSRYSFGWEWYEKCFSFADGNKIGEISPQYMHSEVAVRRICELAGRTKLLIILRDPVDRAYSHFMMDARRMDLSEHQKPTVFHETVSQGDSKYVTYGRYADQLRPVFDAFSDTDIWIGRYDDLVSDPEKLLESVYTFLGVDPNFRPDGIREKVNTSKRYRHRGTFKALQRAIRAGEKMGLGSLLVHLKTSGIRDKIMGWLEEPSAYKPMRRDTRVLLAEYYSSANRDLEKLTGINLAGWAR